MSGPGARRAGESKRRGGYTYIELLVSLGIITLLAGLLVPLIGRGRASAQSISCLAQLRQIGAGFVQYAADNDKSLPDPFAMQTSWEQLIRRYVGNSADVFHCPGDNELFPSIGSSYDWRDTGRPETTLAGKQISDSTRPDAVLAFEALPGWHGRGRMNAVTLSGAASSMDEEHCMADIQSPVRRVAEEQARSRVGRQ